MANAPDTAWSQIRKEEGWGGFLGGMGKKRKINNVKHLH
jgi:hypothetical protein